MRTLYSVAGCGIVQCLQCELVFVKGDSIPPQGLETLYTEAYFEGGASDGYTDYNASEGVLRRQARRTLLHIRRYCPHGALLEIGCAYGFFLLEAKRYFQTRGVEISQFAAEQSRRRGLDVVTGDFAALKLPVQSSDVVCLFDCIEHLQRPFDNLQQVHQVLRSQGVVALTTGDIGSFYARVTGKHWRLMTPPQHLFFFSRSTLTRLLRKVGFKVLDVTYPWKLVPWQLVLHQISPRLKHALEPLGRLPLGLHVNLFDAMLIIAQKE